MEILSIKYADDSQTAIRVTLSDGRILTSRWPCQTWHATFIQAWLDAGGSIAAADPPPAPIDLSDVDNLEKGLKALGLVVAQWAGKTPAQLKAAFKAAWDTLP